MADELDARAAGGRRLKGKVCIVTGAGQGIGRATAKRLGQEGATVVVVDRVDEGASQTLAELREHGVEATKVLVDLAAFAGAQSLMQQTVAAHGRIDVLVNNVGGTIWAKPYQEYEEAQIEAEIRRSLFPTLWCCRAVLPAMIEQGGGAIVNVSSVATRGIHRIPYSAAKGGVNALTASLAFEHAQDGIRVNAVATGGTEAPPRVVPRNPNPPSDQEQAWYQGIVDQTIASSYMHRYGTIDEQVRAILFLASDEASYITGTVLPVGGGDQG